MSGGLLAAAFDRPAWLVLIDLQHAIDDPSWGVRDPNASAAEANAAALLSVWRKAGWPVLHVAHDSTFEASPYRPGQRGNEFKPEFVPLQNEPVLRKRTNSAFIGTDLEARLRAAGTPPLAFAGVATNNSVEATVRMAGNLGFDTWLAGDACYTHDKRLGDGRVFPAADLHAVSLANMDGEYARVATAAWLAAQTALNSHP
jgi:nicotinamidase-related amidase